MKKIRIILRLAMAPGILFFSSCSALLFAPTSQTGHMLEKKGDLATSATLQSTPYTTSLAGDVAYALDNRLFVNANFQYFENNPRNRANFFEIGTGYYSRIGRFGFFESSLMYGQMNGNIEMRPLQIMKYALHVPSLSGVIGIKNKYLFATFGVKGGLLFKAQSTYANYNEHASVFWYDHDPGVRSFEQMHHAAYVQFSGTLGVKYKAVSLSLYNTFMAGPEAYGTDHLFQADQFGAGVRLQLNLNVLRRR